MLKILRKSYYEVSVHHPPTPTHIKAELKVNFNFNFKKISLESVLELLVESHFRSFVEIFLTHQFLKYNPEFSFIFFRVTLLVVTLTSFQHAVGSSKVLVSNIICYCVGLNSPVKNAFLASKAFFNIGTSSSAN